MIDYKKILAECKPLEKPLRDLNLKERFNLMLNLNPDLKEKYLVQNREDVRKCRLKKKVLLKNL